VPVAPPVPAGAPASVSTPASAYGTVDQAVGNPEVDVPPVAVRVSAFARRIFSRNTVFECPGKAEGGVLETGYGVTEDGVVTISGVIDASAPPQVLYVTFNGGDDWSELAGGQPFPTGSVFTYSVDVTKGDVFNFATGSTVEMDRLAITFQTGISVVASQGTFGAVPTAEPGVGPYPAQFVPVSAFPEEIGSVKAGTQATAGTPLVGPFTCPSDGTIGIFGFIQSGQAYFTVALETLSNTPQYAGLNGAVNQTPGAWIGATMHVFRGDVVTVSVSANCVCGTLRVTFTPST
jgi:hypothetical protein